MCPLLVLLQRAGDNHTSIQQGQSSWVPPLSWQRLGYALQPTDMRVIIYPFLCKHWIWIPLTYWKIIVITALTAHKMGIFLTGISAGGPKQKTSSSFHVIHSEFKTILQPLVNDPHSRLHKGGKSYEERGWKREFFFFFGEKHWRAVYSPFLLLQYHLPFKGSIAGDSLLVRMDSWPHTPGRRLAEPQKSKGQKLPRDQSRLSRGNIGNPGTGTWLLWLESLQARGWLEQLWQTSGERTSEQRTCTDGRMRGWVVLGSGGNLKVAGLKSDASKDFLNGVRQPVEATNGSAQGALQFFTYILRWAGFQIIWKWHYS